MTPNFRDHDSSLGTVKITSMGKQREKKLWFFFFFFSNFIAHKHITPELQTKLAAIHFPTAEWSIWAENSMLRKLLTSAWEQLHDGDGGGRGGRNKHKTRSPNLSKPYKHDTKLQKKCKVRMNMFPTKDKQYLSISTGVSGKLKCRWAEKPPTTTLQQLKCRWAVNNHTA